MIFLAMPDPQIHEPRWDYKGPRGSETASGAPGAFVDSYPTSLTCGAGGYQYGSWWASDMATMRRSRHVSEAVYEGPRICTW